MAMKVSTSKENTDTLFGISELRELNNQIEAYSKEKEAAAKMADLLTQVKDTGKGTVDIDDDKTIGVMHSSIEYTDSDMFVHTQSIWSVKQNDNCVMQSRKLDDVLDRVKTMIMPKKEAAAGIDDKDIEDDKEQSDSVELK